MVEAYWNKKRIMEIYLNVIEFGDGIYGAEAAALHHFGKSAKLLKAEESALLAAVLPNPIKHKASKPSKYVKNRQSWILRQMRRWDMKLNYSKFAPKNE